MPTYVYKFVDTGETIEVQQAFHDDTLTEYAHPETGQVLPVKKVFTPVGVTFKGSGFFKTDNRGKASSGTSGAATSGSSSDSSTSGSNTGSSSASTSDSGSGSSTGTSSSASSASSSSGD
jgi:predicted nucleic acid-binding Zn ribbon protein